MLLSPAQRTEEAAAIEAGETVPAGLSCSSDTEPGFSRLRKGDSFAYRDSQGRPVRDEPQLARIRKLAIPPAYTSVWICPSPDGHIQATGRDACGRKEHSHELVLATIVRLLDTTLVRVGNDQYAKENKSYGLTTLRNRHVHLSGSGLRLCFKGKSGVQHDVEVRDPRVCRVVRRCLHLPGQELFQYREAGGTRRTVSSGDVNDYLRAACGEGFTAKDFRTWHGSALALEAMRRLCAAGKPFTLKQLLAVVSGVLGNTPAVCRKAYIHPAVLQLAIQLSGNKDCADHPLSKARAIKGLSATEQRLVAFLKAG